MSDKKIIALIILAISCLTLIFLFAFNLEKDKKTEDQGLANKLEEVVKNKETINTEGLTIKEKAKGNHELPNIEKIIGEFYYYINKKDFEEAYNMLNKEYVELYGLSLEHFKGKYDYENEKIYTIRSTQIEPDRYIIGVDLINKKDLEAGDNGKISRVTFGYIKGKGLDEVGIKWISELKIIEETEKARITIYKEIGTAEGIAYKLTIKNQSPETINIKSDSTGIYAENNERTFEHSLIQEYPKQYRIAPNEEKNLLIYFRHAAKTKRIIFETENIGDLIVNIR